MSPFPSCEHSPRQDHPRCPGRRKTGASPNGRVCRGRLDEQPRSLETGRSWAGAAGKPTAASLPGTQQVLAFSERYPCGPMSLHPPRLHRTMFTNRQPPTGPQWAYEIRFPLRLPPRRRARARVLTHRSRVGRAAPRDRSRPARAGGPLFDKKNLPVCELVHTSAKRLAVKTHLSVVDTYRILPPGILSPGFLSGLFIGRPGPGRRMNSCLGSGVEIPAP